MGDCPASGTVVYEERDRGTLPCRLTLEFWDRDYPHGDDEPRLNVTAEDDHLLAIATSGLSIDQVRDMRDALTKWLDRNSATPPRKERSNG